MPVQNHEPTLNDVRQEFPGWICWSGTGRLFYARRAQTLLGRYDVRGADPLDLQDAIVCFLRTEDRDTRPGIPGQDTRARARTERR